MCVSSEETKGALALGRCPEPVACLLYFYFLIFYKQPKSILSIRDVLQGDICMMGEISGRGQIEAKAPHDLGKG